MKSTEQQTHIMLTLANGELARTQAMLDVTLELLGELTGQSKEAIESRVTQAFELRKAALTKRYKEDLAQTSDPKSQ